MLRQPAFKHPRDDLPLEAMGLRVVQSLFRGRLEVTLGPAAVQRQTMAQMAADIAERYRVSVSEIRGTSGIRIVVLARQELMWRAHVGLGLSSPRVGAFLGHRDHTSVLHGVKRHAERIADGTAGPPSLEPKADPARPSLDDLARRIGHKHGFTVEELTGTGGDTELREARQDLAWLARQRWDYETARIAAYLNVTAGGLLAMVHRQERRRAQMTSVAA